ncbi:50S ribosomal protein L10 [Blastococcus sp. Marseille-P5729]|uniref:50S ribosomal protein L10 n=1 Tax=Blastococcus sp. Marseille-P5729 TaxID=2086582 RepID=UPI000D1068CA|nr:50S ribosomal protein L10 [Blastococcus sp. Marseille-P5729]
MANAEKTAAVKEIADQFTESTAAVLTEYRGLSVAKMTELRKALGADTTYTVVKNTLTKLAAKDAGLDIEDELLNGPTAVAFIRGDIATAAKGLKEFAKDNPLLVIKGGVLEGKTISVDQVKQIADLEPREVLLAKLAGAMKGNLTKAAIVFNALPTKMAQLAEALKEKKPADAAPAAEAPAEAAADAPAEAPAEASEPAAETAES